VLSATVPAAGTAGAAGATRPPLDRLVLGRPLPGYSPAPAGPTDGPLTASEFASQSSDPQQAERQFDALAAQSGFGAVIRLWTDGSGGGEGENDLAVLLFRIPTVRDAQAFAAGLGVPFATSVDATPFAVPSVPGARGYTVQIATPVHAVEQIVVLRTGQYVAMVQLASSAAPTNHGLLTPAQAVAVSFQQFAALRFGDPAGSSALPTAAAPPPVATAPPVSSGTPVALVAAAALLVLAAAVGGVLLVRRRRRPAERVEAEAPDPWGPGGLLEAFGAVVPGTGSASGARPPWPTDPIGAPQARAVPVLATTGAAPSPGGNDAGPEAGPH
jgi:hypothetical protein